MLQYSSGHNQLLVFEHKIVLRTDFNAKLNRHFIHPFNG
jgi:hypothetical protein